MKLSNTSIIAKIFIIQPAFTCSSLKDTETIQAMHSFFLLHNLNCCCCLVVQLCLTLCDPVNCNPSGSSVRGILQARILDWVAISSSRGSSWPRDWTHISGVSWIAGRFFTAEPQGKPRYFRTASFLKKLTRKHNDNDDEQKLLYFLGK